MGTNDRPRPGKRRRKITPLPRAARHVLREWRGYDEARDLNDGLHLAAEHIHSILELAGAAEGLHEDEVRAAWKDIAGEFVAAHSHPVSLKRGELLLRVAQPALRFQLEGMKNDLLGRIRERFGPKLIQTIRFTAG